MQNLPSILNPDLGLLFWMLLAFLIVFLLLKKYGFPVIIKMVEDRKNYIDEALQSAREANEKLANIQYESEEILKKAHEQQAQILKEAMATKDNIIKNAQQSAQAEGNKLLEEAKRQIAIEKENALKSIRTTVTDLSVQIAEKVMRRQLEDHAEQEKYIERILDEFESK